MIWYRDGLISGKLSYALCLDEEIFLRLMKRVKIYNHNDFLLSGSNASVHNFQNEKDAFSVLCIEKMESPIMMIGLIIHEAKHIHDFDMELIREEKPGREISCYCLQRITQTILNDMATFSMEYKK